MKLIFFLNLKTEKVNVFKTTAWGEDCVQVFFFQNDKSEVALNKLRCVPNEFIPGELKSYVL
jgi:hypothetical protein